MAQFNDCIFDVAICLGIFAVVHDIFKQVCIGLMSVFILLRYEAGEYV